MTASVKFEYFHLLSGVDYPCVSNEMIDEVFEKANGHSFMHFDSPGEVQEWRLHKYPERMRWHFNDNPFLKKTRVIARLLNMFFPRKSVPNLYAGWQWWSWHRNVVEYVLDYLNKNKAYYSRFRFTSCCDEVIFHTMLYSVADHLKIEKYNSLRYIDWHPNRPYQSLPLILDERDFNSIKNSDCLFCRKVAEASDTLLNKLDDITYIGNSSSKNSYESL